jgi:antitoxin MazE
MWWASGPSTSTDRSRERALERVRALRKELPPDWKFDRAAANLR